MRRLESFADRSHNRTAVRARDAYLATPMNQPLELDQIMRREIKGRKIEEAAEVSSKLLHRALSLNGAFL